MKYRIKQHIGFSFRRPVHILESECKNKADGRCDRGEKLSVNVLVMAKDKKKNKKVTAGDLFGKLGKHGHDSHGDKQNEFEEEAVFLEDIEDVNGVAGVDNIADRKTSGDSIDVSSSGVGDDSELDINELLRKYMPEYDEKESEDKDETAHTGGILSRLKNSEKAENVAESAISDDEQLISSLDSAFGIPKTTAPKKTAYDDGFIDEYELEPEADENVSEDDYAEITDRDEPLISDEEFLADSEPESEVEVKKPKFSLFGRKKQKKSAADTAKDSSDDELLEMVTDEKPVADTVTDDVAADTVTEPVAETADEVEAVSEPDMAEDIDETTYDDLMLADAEDALLSADIPEDTKETLPTETEKEENEEETLSDEDIASLDDEEFDPTDINLMVAFGLDGKDNKKAKEFGDRLAEKQHHRDTHKVKLDHPEYVDKTQIPTIRKEFHDKNISLWIRLVVCAVFTVALMIFENIPLITKLFSGNEQQFAGVFDPAVYPVVYIMVSLQLMLLACFCAVEEIIKGFKNIFRGTPTPESMTALLTIGGIVYSAVMAVVTVSPNEPVMFNFVTAVSALLTLVYALYNNKRENMNFAVLANRKPKHIVRRLPDEESEGEARAFADAEDACDVMKIEKTDFIDGFFGRLSRPDPATGVFMTFAMSASVAIAVLFGIFVNFRGGDTATVSRVVYSALLMLAPLSAYVTFSYPMYRANLAAKQYDSAIIGDASIEEYSNASIISFDDKNVFPSYSVKVQNMRIYNNARIDRVLYYAASVFAYAGGPLQDVFEVATRDMGVSENVKIFDTESGFLAAQVDGVNIIFGSGQNLRSRGLDIPDDALVDDVDLSDELSIMYMFRESKLVAKFYVKYVMDSDIDLILKQFSGSGLYVCVRTFDPNIDEAMIAKKAGMKKMPLKILRYSSAEEVSKYEEKVDSGLVTCGSPKSLLQVITYCGKVLHTKKTDIALGVLSVMIGAAILVLLLLADSLTVLSSLLIVLYQLVWLIPISVASKVFIR